MFESGLIEQVLRIINTNYKNIYAIDITLDKVYIFEFTIANTLIIKDTISYTDFIEMAKRFVHPNEINQYFEILSLNNLELEAKRGNNETKFKYRRLCETGEYRWFVNIINYLPFDNKKLIFMMSEDVQDRLIDSEEDSLKLRTEVNAYEKRIKGETESITDAILKINTVLDNNSSGLSIGDTKAYINSIFNQVSIDHPELNRAILDKMANSVSYKKPTLLIVDDSSIIRNSLKRIFSSDFNIMMAKDGKEAIEIISQNIINTGIEKENVVGVLLDLIMPVSDGFDVLDFMKENNLLTKVPVAIISGDETRETRKRVYEYDIVDMLEKPFNTDNIKRRLSKIINLYMSGNHLQNIIEIQNNKMENESKVNDDGIKKIIGQIVDNILNSKESIKLKKMTRLFAITLANKFPKYNLNSKYIDAIVNTCALYNIGSIAMNEDMVITSQNIKEEISYGLEIAKYTIQDEYERNVAVNIIKYSLEMFDGSGYPDNIKGNNIPIEASITNLIVRISQNTNTKSFLSVIKNLIEKENSKYNPDLLEVLDEIKKELKELI